MTKFKVGDKVKVIKPIIGYDGNGVQIGDVRTVRSNGRPYILFNNVNGDGAYLDADSKYFGYVIKLSKVYLANNGEEINV